MANMIAAFQSRNFSEDVALVMVTSSKDLAQRHIELGEWEQDELGFPNELSGQEYDVLLYLERSEGALQVFVLPEPIEQMEGEDRRQLLDDGGAFRLLNSLAKGQRLILKEDRSRNEQGEPVEGILCAMIVC